MDRQAGKAPWGMIDTADDPGHSLRPQRSVAYGSRPGPEDGIGRCHLPALLLCGMGRISPAGSVNEKAPHTGGAKWVIGWRINQAARRAVLLVRLL